MLLPYLEDCENKCQKKIDELSETLVSGRIQSMESYCSLCGEIRGIRVALQLMKDVIKGYQNPNYLSEFDNLD